MIFKPYPSISRCMMALLCVSIFYACSSLPDGKKAWYAVVFHFIPINTPMPYGLRGSFATESQCFNYLNTHVDVRKIAGHRLYFTCIQMTYTNFERLIKWSKMSYKFVNKR